MAEEGLRIKIGADVTELNKGLKTAETSVQSFGKSVNRSVPQATQAFTNLGRVVQDAPFGFIGIQNNIEPLIQSFQTLRTSTGSTGGALKALAGSLLGGGGLLLGFSLVTSAITVAIQKYGSLGAAFKAIFGNLSSLEKFQTSYNKSVAESIGNAQGEIASIKSLIAVARDENQSRGARLTAIKELKKEGKGYLEFLTLENVGSQQTAQGIDRLTNSLLLQARARGLQDVISSNEKKKFEAQNKPLSEQLTFWQKILYTKNLAGDVAPAFQDLAAAKGLENTTKEVTELERQSKLAGTALTGIQAELKALEQFKVDPVKVTKGLSKAVKDAFKFVGGEIETVELNKLIKFSDYTVSPDALKAFQSIPKAVEKTLANQPITVTPKIQFGPVALAGIASLDAIKTKTQEVTTQFNEFLAPAIQTVFGALENGQSIPKALAQSFKAMLVQITATIAKAAILATILNVIFPGGSVIGGNAVKGFGGIFKALLGGVAAPNLGGIQGGGLSLSGGVRLEARGTDLVGVISNSNARIGRVG